MKLADCKDRKLYQGINGPDFDIGVYDATRKAFVGLRDKGFGPFPEFEYVEDLEYWYNDLVEFGSAPPEDDLKELDTLPDNIGLWTAAETDVVYDEMTGMMLVPDKDKNCWCFAATNETSPDIRQNSLENYSLLEWLIEQERKYDVPA